MESARPLRDVFADLAGHHEAGQGQADGQAFLAEHAGLPAELLVTAIGSYADTAPAEVAEHLAPIVAAGATQAAGGVDAVHGLNLLASAPVGEWQGEVPLDGEAGDHPDDGGHLTHFADSEHLDPDHFSDSGHFGDLGQLDHLGSADSLDQVHHVPGQPELHLDHAEPAVADGGPTGEGEHVGFSDGDTSGSDHHAVVDDGDPADHLDQGHPAFAEIPVAAEHADFAGLPGDSPDHDDPDLQHQDGEQHAEEQHDGHDLHDLGDLGHFG